MTNLIDQADRDLMDNETLQFVFALTLFLSLAIFGAVFCVALFGKILGWVFS